MAFCWLTLPATPRAVPAVPPRTLVQSAVVAVPSMMRDRALPAAPPAPPDEPPIGLPGSPPLPSGSCVAVRAGEIALAAAPAPAMSVPVTAAGAAAPATSPDTAGIAPPPAVADPPTPALAAAPAAPPRANCPTVAASRACAPPPMRLAEVVGFAHSANDRPAVNCVGAFVSHADKLLGSSFRL